MAVEITRATHADTPGLVACIDAAYAGYRASGIELPPVSEGIAEDIANALVWIARDDGRIAGGLILSIDHHVATLKNVAVHPEYAGLGIGQKLIHVAEGAAGLAGCAVMRLTTHAEMPRNVALYERLGWQVMRRDGLKVVMERRLT